MNTNTNELPPSIYSPKRQALLITLTIFGVGIFLTIFGYIMYIVLGEATNAIHQFFITMEAMR